MLKKDLITQISEDTLYTKSSVESILKAFENAVLKELGEKSSTRLLNIGRLDVQRVRGVRQRNLEGKVVNVKPYSYLTIRTFQPTKDAIKRAEKQSVKIKKSNGDDQNVRKSHR